MLLHTRWLIIVCAMHSTGHLRIDLHCKKYGGYTHHVGGIIPPFALPTMVGLSSLREPTKIRGIIPPSAIPTTLSLSSLREPTKIRGIIPPSALPTTLSLSSLHEPTKIRGWCNTQHACAHALKGED